MGWWLWIFGFQVFKVLMIVYDGIVLLFVDVYGVCCDSFALYI